jgi:hypothetical protein
MTYTKRTIIYKANINFFDKIMYDKNIDLKCRLDTINAALCLNIIANDQMTNADQKLIEFYELITNYIYSHNNYINSISLKELNKILYEVNLEAVLGKEFLTKTVKLIDLDSDDTDVSVEHKYIHAICQYVLDHTLQKPTYFSFYRHKGKIYWTENEDGTKRFLDYDELHKIIENADEKQPA